MSLSKKMAGIVRMGTSSMLVLILLISAAGCRAKEMTVNVVVFNYTSRPLGEVTVQGHYIEGYLQEYGPGGTGGGISCCIDMEPGVASVSWEYDRNASDNRPDDYFKRSVSGVVPDPSAGHKYLGVHIYPDERVEFTLTRDIPSEKKEGASI